MATTATITPTLGAAPVTLQAGNYSAIDDRRFWGSGVREGAISGGSYQVIQRAAGANMTVDVASSVGSGAVVQGDSVTAQGNYLVPPTAANVNVDIAAADATNPRNDLVVLEVKDDQHDAGGLNLARVRVITGTANASAAGTDAPGANGTPALPSSCLLLAVVRVTAAATSVTTAMINDRRPWVGGAPSFETSLPSPAADGQEIYYRADSTNGVIWHLRYRNAFNSGSTTYPWEYLGGGSQIDGPKLSAAAAVNTTSNTYQTVTGGPSITVPLKGEYVVDFSARLQALSAAAYDSYAGISIGGVAPAGSPVITTSSGQYDADQVFLSEKRALLASDALTIQYRSTNPSSTAISQLLIKVTPIRVGT